MYNSFSADPRAAVVAATAAIINSTPAKFSAAGLNFRARARFVCPSES